MGGWTVLDLAAPSDRRAHGSHTQSSCKRKQQQQKKTLQGPLWRAHTSRCMCLWREFTQPLFRKTPPYKSIQDPFLQFKRFVFTGVASSQILFILQTDRPNLARRNMNLGANLCQFATFRSPLVGSLEVGICLNSEDAQFFGFFFPGSASEGLSACTSVQTEGTRHGETGSICCLFWA